MKRSREEHALPRIKNTVEVPCECGEGYVIVLKKEHATGAVACVKCSPYEKDEGNVDTL